uniref:Uncharacterized protein n=1 Tax=Panagrolaimus sp. ES5 TaxID=591445 RepID=A0AC34F5M2_9BILA
MAVIPLEITLQRLLQCDSFRSKLLMPSMFFGNETSTHPFCSQRAVDLYDLFGGDYLAIQLYDDDFGTTNPLQTGSASLYKMIGCYNRILNLSAEFQSTFEHIFLAYLAYANDMALNRHAFLRATIVHQLRQLEDEGITVLVNGSQIHFRVALFNLIGDNLGLNQNGGYKSYFLGDNACRICHFNWEEIGSIFEMSDDRLRTAEEYDEAALSENLNVRNSWGVKENSAFNDLELFHVQENPSVDLMHDLFQGHIRYLIPLVFRSFENYENVFNAVAAFPFQGKDSFNIPRPTQNGDRMKQIKGMTASTMSTFIRLLPLILADLVQEEGNEVWDLLLLFQKIYDIVMAQHANSVMLENLKLLVQQYLSEFKRLGGHMTVKPHYMTHYDKMIRMYGPLRFSWSMRYEAKHQPFKQYSNVNRCHKNLPYTLAWKHQAFACTTMRKMEKPYYFDRCLSKTYDNLYKIGDIVVLGKLNDIPQFGKIYVKQSNDILGMTSSTIKLSFFDADGVTVHHKRFAITDDSFTVAAAIQNGLDRLEIGAIPCQLNMIGQKRGSDKNFQVSMDDLIELDHEYTFSDPQLEAALTESTTMASSVASPPVTPGSTYGGHFSTSTTPQSGKSAFVRSPATPTSSRSTFVSRSPLSSQSTPVRYSSARITVDDSLDFSELSPDAMSASITPTLSANSTPTSSNTGPKYTSLSKTKKIGNFYIENMKDIDEFYVSKKEAPGRMFHEVDVIGRLGLFQQWKAAFFVLCQQTNPDLYDAAVYVIADACFDILRCVWPKLNVIPAEKQLLAELVSDLTGYADLKNLTLPNRCGNLDYKLKHFRRQHPDGSVDAQSPAAKRPKLSADAAMDAVLDRLSIEMNPETDSRALHKLYEKSAPPNCCKIIVRNFTPVDSGYLSICSFGIPDAAETYDSPDEREYMAGALLAAILKKKCRKAAVEYSRIVMDHSDDLNHRDAMNKRKAEGITAPTILIIGSAPVVSFFIAADDMLFKMNMKEHQNPSRMAVSKKLEEIAASITKSTAVPDNQIPQNVETSGRYDDANLDPDV